MAMLNNQRVSCIFHGYFHTHGDHGVLSRPLLQIDSSIAWAWEQITRLIPCVSVVYHINIISYIYIYKYINLSIYLSINQSIYLSIYQSIYLSIYQSIIIYPSIYQSINLSINLSIYLSINLSIYLLNKNIYQSIYQALNLSIKLSI